MTERQNEILAKAKDINHIQSGKSPQPTTIYFKDGTTQQLDYEEWSAIRFAVLKAWRDEK